MKQEKSDEYFVINPDGSESILHVDNFTRPFRRSKNPRRIQIIHVDDGLPHKSFQEEFQEMLARDELL